jgi:osmoprotectant transport system permease protein
MGSSSLGFENTYALAMPEAEAERMGIERISDLVPHAPDMEIGGDYEFFDRAEWDSLQSAYGFEFDGQRAMDPALMYQAAGEANVDLISAFSTDGRIEAYDLRVLEDDRHAIPPYDAIVLASERAAHEHPEALAVLRELDGSIDVATMRRLNHEVDAQGDAPAEVAARFLRTL